MRIKSRRKRPFPTWHWGIPLALLAGVALVILLAPEERTLGSGIRSVYLHVGLVWVGLLGFGVTTVLGTAVLLTKKLAWLRWLIPAS
ncbi:MAG: hypothetical protein GY805_12210 [Chloroflexi bacterium]|nr:hypothetical protein [Chloroflexota bacterium]